MSASFLPSVPPIDGNTPISFVFDGRYADDGTMIGHYLKIELSADFPLPPVIVNCGLTKPWNALLHDRLQRYDDLVIQTDSCTGDDVIDLAKDGVRDVLMNDVESGRSAGKHKREDGFDSDEQQKEVVRMIAQKKEDENDHTRRMLLFILENAHSVTLT
ncbi:hypothetical protein MBANPS3_009727 [Mucor bainieri]